MSEALKKINYTSFWHKLIGDPEEFEMDNRAFNFVCIITFALLLFYQICNFIFGFYLMSVVNIGLIAILTCLYFLSRFKKEYKRSVVFYAFCSYTALMLNYKYDAGLEGPTLFAFFVSFLLLIAISPRTYYWLWITLHLGVALCLMYNEYYNPAWVVPNIYGDKLSKYLDIYLTYFSAIIIIYVITNFLRMNLEIGKKLADLRAKEIAVQNEKIIRQKFELEKINDEKNKLFSIISHDLRTPVDSLMGYLGVLSQYDINDKERLELEADLFNQTKYASHLLQNLLYWSKTQMHGVKVNRVPFNVKNIIYVSSEFKTSIAAKKNIKLTYDVAPDLIVTADKEMMQIVIRNLVNNAIKFTRPEGEITIKAFGGDNGEAIIAIKDTGIGMTPEKQKEMFSLRSKSTYGTQNEKGVGLGLLLCKDFMEHQGGRIWFESEEGKGSEFFLALPISNN